MKWMEKQYPHTEEEYIQQCEEEYHDYMSSLSPEEREYELQLNEINSKINKLESEKRRLEFERRKLNSTIPEK